MTVFAAGDNELQRDLLLGRSGGVGADQFPEGDHLLPRARHGAFDQQVVVLYGAIVVETSHWGNVKERTPKLYIFDTENYVIVISSRFISSCILK